MSLAAIDDRTLILREHQYLEDDPSFEPSLPRIMRCRVEDRALVCTSSQAPVESQQPPRL